MGRIRVSKEFNFEMAHALWNYDGACKNIHGHSYRLFVTILGSPISDPTDPKFGMVLDFKDLKKLVKGPIVDYFDHALVLYKEVDGETLSVLISMKVPGARNQRSLKKKVYSVPSRRKPSV